MNQPRGFAGYGEIVTWLASEYGICVNYWVVYDLVRCRWKAKLKAAHPAMLSKTQKPLPRSQKGYVQPYGLRLTCISATGRR